MSTGDSHNGVLSQASPARAYWIFGRLSPAFSSKVHAISAFSLGSLRSYDLRPTTGSPLCCPSTNYRRNLCTRLPRVTFLSLDKQGHLRSSSRGGLIFGESAWKRIKIARRSFFYYFPQRFCRLRPLRPFRVPPRCEGRFTSSPPSLSEQHYFWNSLPFCWDTRRACILPRRLIIVVICTMLMFVQAHSGRVRARGIDCYGIMGNIV